MSWKSRLRPASWRGVAFEVEGTSGTFGRRTARHEYPQRDTPAVEDLGRATRELRLSAFVIGDDYMSRRDELILAAEKAGPGILVHPYLGRMRVVCETFSLGEVLLEGRVARLEFTFVEAGELSFPTGRKLSLGLLEGAADAVKKAAKADFVAAFSLDEGLFLAGKALADVNGKLDEIGAALAAPGAVIDDLAGVVKKLDSLKDDAATLLDTPAAFADSFQDLLGALEQLAGYDQLLGDGSTGDDPVPNQTTPGEIQEEDNRTALQRLHWRSCLAGAALAIANVTFDSYDDAVEARDKLAERTATEAEVESVAGSVAAYETLADLRTGISEDVTARAADLARLRTVSVYEGAALPLAYELYQDRDRAGEIVARNKVPNGAFLFGELRVLSA